MSMNSSGNYKVLISKDALDDIVKYKRYILTAFRYPEYAENFSRMIKKAIRELIFFPITYIKTGYIVEGMEIYYKPCSTYLIFYIIQDYRVIIIRVLKDSMDWQSILERISRINL